LASVRQPAANDRLRAADARHCIAKIRNRLANVRRCVPAVRIPLADIRRQRKLLLPAGKGDIPGP
jgi:hypothetical protein